MPVILMMWPVNGLKQTCHFIVLHPSLGSARIRLELLSKKLGSARAIFQKARSKKNQQNEPIWGLLANLTLFMKNKFRFKLLGAFS